MILRDKPHRGKGNDGQDESGEPDTRDTAKSKAPYSTRRPFALEVEDSSPFDDLEGPEDGD